MAEKSELSDDASVRSTDKLSRKLYSWALIWTELKVLVNLSAPTIIQGAAQQGLLFTDQIFLGHLGTVPLAASALGTTYSNVFWFFLLGASTALDTLGAQAYGANNHTALITVTFTATVVLSVITAISSVCLCFGQQVAQYIFAQEADVARLVGQYCWGLMPGMWPLFLSLVLMKYLQTQNMMLAPAVTTLISFVLNIGFNAGFIAWFGFVGAPLATTMSRLVQFLLLSYIVYRYECKRVHDGASRMNDSFNDTSRLEDGSSTLSSESKTEMQPLTSPEDSSYPSAFEKSQVLRKQPSWFKKVSSFKELSRQINSASSHLGLRELLWGSNVQSIGLRSMLSYFIAQSKAAVRPVVLSHFLKLALPGGFMLAFEAGAFDFTTGMAGHLGSPVLTAAHSAMFGFIYLAYCSFPYAIATAATIRTGNLLGANDPDLARMSSFLSIAASMSFMTLIAIIILSCRNVVGYVFSSDPSVVANVAKIAPYAALFQISDGILGPGQGILRACGRQIALMVNTIIGFWLAGILLGYLLAFKAGLGLVGLWIGLACGDWVTALLHGGTFLLINWCKEAAKAVANLQGIKEEHAGAVEDSCKAADLEVTCIAQGSNGSCLHHIDERHIHESMIDATVGKKVPDKSISERV